MTSGRTRDLLTHILEAAEQARTYVAGLDKATFLSDKRTQQAVIMNLVIIGEAAARLAEEDPGLVVDHPEVPWKSMRGMRNRIAHGYFELDPGIVWDTVHVALPDLIERIRSIH